MVIYWILALWKPDNWRKPVKEKKVQCQFTDEELEEMKYGPELEDAGGGTWKRGQDAFFFGVLLDFPPPAYLQVPNRVCFFPLICFRWCFFYLTALCGVSFEVRASPTNALIQIPGLRTSLSYHRSGSYGSYLIILQTAHPHDYFLNIYHN